MITQTYKQGEHEIKIESAESLEDAQNNNFKEGVYTRFYINNKLSDNYMAMIRFIVDEVKQNKNSLISTNNTLMEQRKQMFKKQNEEMNKQLDTIKEQYEDMGIPKNIVDKIDNFAERINSIGMRVKK